MLKQWFAKDSVKALGVFLILLLILFSSVFFKGEVFGGGDTTAAKGMTHQLNIYHNETGEYPLWQPYIFSGMPAFSSMMYHKWVYFPNLVLGVFNKIGIPALWTMLLHYLFAAMGAYTLLRYLKVDMLSAILGGIAYMLTPFFVVMISAGHGSQMMTAAYLPWIIYAVKRIMEEPDLKGLLLLAIIAGFQFQRGHVQVAYYGWMAAGWYVVIEMIFRAKAKQWEGFSKSAVFLVVGLMLGLGLAAVQYVPSLAYAAHSIRGGSAGGGLDYGYATSWSFPPSEVIALFFSDWFGFGGQNYWGGKPFTEHSDYLGLTLLVLMAAAFLNKEHFKEKIYLLSTILLALLVSFGNYWPYLYDLMFKVLPFFNKFRVPSMILILLELMAGLLAGIGLYTLLNLGDEKKASLQRKALIAFGSLGGLFVLVLLFKNPVSNLFLGALSNSPKMHPALQGVRVDMFYSSLIKSLFLGTISLGIVWAFFTDRIKGMVVSIGFLLLVVIDLGHVDLRFATNTTAPKRLNEAEQETPAIRQLKELTKLNPGRILPAHTLFGSNEWAMHGLESVGGYSPAKLKILQDFLNYTQIEQTFLPKYYNQTAEGVVPKEIAQVDPVLRKKHLDAMRTLNVKYIVSPYPMDDPLFKPIAQPTHIVRGQRVPVVIYEFQSSFPKAWFVSEIQFENSIGFMNSEFYQSEKYPHNLAVVVNPHKTIAQTTFGVGSVSVVDRSLQSLTLKTNNETDGFLVVSEVFYSGGWVATLDGEHELEIYRTDGLIRGVQVPAGEHEIRFTYEPAAVEIGFRLTFMSFIVVMGLAAYLFYKSRMGSTED